MIQPWFLMRDEQDKGPAFMKSVLLSDISKIDRSKVAYLVIDGRNQQQAESMLRTVRQNSLPALYLLPIVILHNNFSMPDIGSRYADAYHSIDDFNAAVAEGFITQFEGVNRWIISVVLDNVSGDSNIALRVLRYMVSRDQSFNPVATAKALSGYVYPQLELLFEGSDVGLLETLEFLAEQRLVTGDFYTKAHFCSHCECAFLNFEETCPHCQSTNLTIDELVHHFKCAYTGELSEFKQGEAMICPKCELQLKHIGVDYDKPSIVYRCNQCSHSFQNPPRLGDLGVD